MGNTFAFAWELSLLKWIQSSESPFMTALAKCATLPGEELFLIFVVGLCFWCFNKRLGRNVALAVTGSILSGSLIKGAVLRRRPYMDHPEIKCIRLAHPGEDPMSVLVQGYSFPSLHSALATGGYGTLARNAKKKALNIIVPILVVPVGLSRIYLGVHYPTDVLCGWVLGIIVMLLFGKIEQKHGYKAAFTVQLLLGIPGLFYCRDSDFCAIYGIIIGLFLGFWYEEKCVRFEMCKKRIGYVLRPLLGMLVFVAVSALLKLPVKGLAADEHLGFQLAYRTFRYALASFVTIGVYPRLFKQCRFL